MIYCHGRLDPIEILRNEIVYRNFPNKRPGRLLTQHPRQGSAYLGQMNCLLYKNAKLAQKGGRLFGRGRLFGKIRYTLMTLIFALL